MATTGALQGSSTNGGVHNSEPGSTASVATTTSTGPGHITQETIRKALESIDDLDQRVSFKIIVRNQFQKFCFCIIVIFTICCQYHLYIYLFQEFIGTCLNVDPRKRVAARDLVQWLERIGPHTDPPHNDSLEEGMEEPAPEKMSQPTFSSSATSPDLPLSLHIAHSLRPLLEPHAAHPDNETSTGAASSDTAMDSGVPTTDELNCANIPSSHNNHQKQPILHSTNNW